jgi:hypothetical protein
LNLLQGERPLTYNRQAVTRIQYPNLCVCARLGRLRPSPGSTRSDESWPIAGRGSGRSSCGRRGEALNLGWASSRAI